MLLSERPRLYIPRDRGRVSQPWERFDDYANEMKNESNGLSDVSQPEPMEQPTRDAEESRGTWCPRCGAVVAGDETTDQFRVCGVCDYHHPESARAAILRL